MSTINLKGTTEWVEKNNPSVGERQVQFRVVMYSKSEKGRKNWGSCYHGEENWLKKKKLIRESMFLNFVIQTVIF